MMISKKMIVVFACAALLFTGCGTGERDAKISNGADAGETIGTAGNTSDMISQALEKTEEAAGMSNEVIREQEEQAEQIPLHPHYEQNDAYKLFYGTWEITKIVSEHGQDGGDKGFEDILGMQVTYLPDRYEFGGIVTVDHPDYLISIYPSGSSLMGDLKQSRVGEDTIILPENEVFVLVEIVNKPSGVEDGRSYGFEPYIGNEFFVKDDNTLYCYDYNCIYEMKRVSYDEVSEEAVESVPGNYHYEQNDAYKLFYGTWEITDIVSESRYLGGDGDCEDILGMQVTYLPNKYEFGETVVSRNPNYLISILPTDDRLLFGQRQVSMDILLPDSEYFVWVQIADMPALSEAVDGGSYDFEPYAGSNFFLKDDNTLYLFAYSCIYELNRVSYTDDYDPRYMPGCWERW